MVRSTVERNVLSNDSRVCSKLVTPEALAKNDHMIVAGLIFIAREDASQQGLSLQNGKKFRRNAARAHELWLSLPREIERRKRIDCDLLEDVILGGPIQIIRRRHCKLLHSRKALLRRRMPDLHQLIRLGERQRAQQHRIHHAEDRSVRSNTEGEDEDSGDRKAAASVQGADSVTKFLLKILHRLHLAISGSGIRSAIERP